MKRFKSPRQVQRCHSTHHQFANLFLRRDHDTAANLRSGRTQAFATWGRRHWRGYGGMMTPIAGIAQPIALYVNL